MVWEQVNGVLSHYNHWPNPFHDRVKSIQVLACEDTWQAKIEMHGLAWGDWFFTNIVPQPTEIARKSLLGGYKCGFYLKVRSKSPLDLVFRQHAPTVMLAEIARPFVTALFYFWAANTTWEAMSTWQSLVYAAEICDTQQNEVLRGDAHGPVFAEGETKGVPIGWTNIYDPNGWAPNANGPINILQPRYVVANAFVTVVTTRSVSECQVSIFGGGDPIGDAFTFADLGAIAPGGSAQAALSWEGTLNAGVINVGFRVVQGPGIATFTDVVAVRMTVTQTPVKPEQKCVAWNPGQLGTPSA